MAYDRFFITNENIIKAIRKALSLKNYNHIFMPIPFANKIR